MAHWMPQWFSEGSGRRLWFTEPSNKELGSAQALMEMGYSVLSRCHWYFSCSHLRTMDLKSNHIEKTLNLEYYVYLQT